MVNTLFTVTQPQMQNQESDRYQDTMSAYNKWNVILCVLVCDNPACVSCCCSKCHEVSRIAQRARWCWKSVWIFHDLFLRFLWSRKGSGRCLLSTVAFQNVDCQRPDAPVWCTSILGATRAIAVSQVLILWCCILTVLHHVDGQVPSKSQLENVACYVIWKCTEQLNTCWQKSVGAEVW